MSSRKVEGEKRTVEQGEIEDRLLLILETRGEDGLNRFRDRAEEIADQLDWQPSFKKLNLIISSLLATHSSSILKSSRVIARALGTPYDASRIALFQKLAASLRHFPFSSRPEKTKSPEAFELIAFFESFFSNYIEGTTFLVEEAREIVSTGIPLPNRTGDSHDMLATFAICKDRSAMEHLPKTEEMFLEILRERRRIVMGGRPDKNPGQFKEKSNRADSTHFVEPKLVNGTLRHGFRIMEGLTDPIGRALYMMFLVSEVHPFDDGNGRLARIMMNAELVKGRVSKIMIPTVYRDDYMLNLKRLTRKEDASAFIRMMDRAHAFSHWLEPISFDSLHDQLERSNAFFESDEAALRFPL